MAQVNIYYSTIEIKCIELVKSPHDQSNKSYRQDIPEDYREYLEKVSKSKVNI